MVKRGKWDYPNDVGEFVKINKDIRKEFTDISKKLKINKCKLIEEFYKTIIMRYRDQSLICSQGYLTINLFREPIRHSPNQ